MSSTTLFRLSGVILLISVILNVVVSLLSVILLPDSSPDAPISAMKSVFWSPVLYLSLLTLILFLMGLPGLYLRQAEQAGWLGLVGFFLLLISSLMQISVGSFFTEVLPLFAQKAPALIGQTPAGIALMGLGGTLVGLIGMVLLGISVIRSKVFPRLAGMLIIVIGILNLVGGSGMGLIAALVGLLSALLGVIAYGQIATRLLSHPKTEAVAPAV